MSRKMFWFILALIVVGGAITGCGKEEVSVSDTLSPAQVKQQAMEDAAYYNSFVVEFNYEHATDSDRYAICNGIEKIISLDKGETRRAELSSQEALNASLCEWNEESGRWGAVQDIGGVSPGDYLVWDNCLHWTRYTP